jgi:hypothetical protein
VPGTCHAERSEFARIVWQLRGDDTSAIEALVVIAVERCERRDSQRAIILPHCFTI